MKKRLCALYMRVSTLRQADVEDGSMDAQESKLKAYVAFENKNRESQWHIAGIYREEGRSGKDLKRPEFQRMINDIEAGRVNTVIVYKIDRLSRSIKDFSSLWDNFQRQGIEIISLNEKFDTATAIGRAMLSLVLVFAQLEREQTAERTAATMQYRAEQGLWNGGRVIGYELDPNDKGTIKINNEQARMVRKAFDLCIKEGSAGQVQKRLNDLGYRMPEYESRRGKRHGGGLFDKQLIIKMLQNPVYLGKITWNGKLYDGRHEGIIEEETFNRVQRILNKNRKTRSNALAPSEHIYLLQGILICGKCGSAMTPKSGISHSNRYYYYQCTKNAHTGNNGCNAKYVPAEPIENFVLDRVKELTTDESEISKMIAKANAKGNQRLAELLDDRKNLSSQSQNINRKLKKIVDSIESGSLRSFDSLNKRIEALEIEKATIEEGIKSIDFEIDEIENQRLSSEVMSQSFRTFKDVLDKASPRRLKELLSRIVEAVEWNENDKASGHCRISYFEQPYLKLPTKKHSEPDGEFRFAESDNWLPG